MFCIPIKSAIRRKLAVAAVSLAVGAGILTGVVGAQASVASAASVSKRCDAGSSWYYKTSEYKKAKKEGRAPRKTRCPGVYGKVPDTIKVSPSGSYKY